MKRVIDVTAAAVGLVMASPVLLVAGILVAADVGRPILFQQRRLGLNRRPFRIIKFRTMHDLRDDHGFPLPDQDRMTRIGRLLRASSIDELPELANVLIGDMSLVGPRPLLVEYDGLYAPEQHRRHDVRPGLTGLAQISGRNAISWEEKFALDLWYVDHLSFWVDAKILILTLVDVILRRGISQPGHATVMPFGSRDSASEGR